jgi:acetyl esterase/lipase
MVHRVCAALAALAILAGCGSEDRGRGEIEVGGHGALSAVLFLPDEVPEPAPAVLFLHGWGAPDPDPYEPWIEHLVDRGNVVIYPRYQDSPLEPPTRVLGNALAGIRAGLSELPIDRDSLVAVGHSAGGALAADYAAIARSAGLPAPRAVLAVYPGRKLDSWPAAIPVVNPAQIPRDTLLMALTGEEDDVVGAKAARAIIRGAIRVPRAHRMLAEVSEDAVDDHFAPTRADAAAQRAFWRRLDLLIDRARSGRSG